MTSRHRLQVYATVFAVAVLGIVGSASAATKSMKVPSDASVDINIISWLEHVPPTGLMPITVSVRNLSTEPGKWQVSAIDADYVNGTMQSTFTVAAPAGGETRTNLLVPVMPSYDNSVRMYKNMRLSVEGPGVGFPGFAGILTSPTISGSTGSRASPRTSFIAVSEAFNSKLSGRWVKSLTREWNGDAVDTASAPVDWRGYSSLAQFWMMDAEWRSLTSQQREAVLAWVAQGGWVFICTASTATDNTPLPDGFGPWNGDERQHGLGSLKVMTEEAAIRHAETAVSRNDELVLDRAVRNRASERESLAALIPALKMNGTLIFFFILIFGIAVGPVNLFWLAAGSRRPRLFWTTPLISCAGTAVLLVVMVLQDGFGGSGARVSLAIVLPQQKQMTVVQEQFAKTGILTGGAFELPLSDAAFITPVPEAHQIKSRYGSPTMRFDKRNYAVNGAQASGGWFSSRTVQSHLINSQRMNRGGIEVGGGDKPYVISSLSTPLRLFFFQDDKQRFWKADAVPVGQRTSLKPTTKAEVLDWKRTAVKLNMSNLMRYRIDRCLPMPEGWFFAEAADASKISIPTLDSILWPEDRAFLSGMCVPAVNP